MGKAHLYNTMEKEKNTSSITVLPRCCHEKHVIVLNEHVRDSIVV